MPSPTEVMTDTAIDLESPAATFRRYARIIAAVRKLHKPFRIYEECDHDEHGDDADLIECEDFTTCEDGYLHSICTECCTTDVYGTREQTENCAGAHRHDDARPLCATIAALDGTP
jgi:hypothetical protein